MISTYKTALRYIRQLNRISVTSLAEQLNLNAKTVTNYESGKHATSKKVIEQLKILFPYVPESYYTRAITRLDELDLYRLHCQHYYDKIIDDNEQFERTKIYDMYNINLTHNQVILEDIKSLLETHSKYATIFEIFVDITQMWNLNLLRCELTRMKNNPKTIDRLRETKWGSYY
jgi:transcriptional regulator with XRE-family HTH domain